MKKSFRWVGWGGVGGDLNPNLVSTLAPFALVKVGADIGAELDNLNFEPLRKICIVENHNIRF